jgi:hypothetical protein
MQAEVVVVEKVLQYKGFFIEILLIKAKAFALAFLLGLFVHQVSLKRIV